MNSTEAETIRMLFVLYEQRKTLNLVALEAERLGLRSKRYVTQSGRDQGGKVMSRGHIHKILTNPLYVGRIAHKGITFEGQHPSIIEAGQWDRVQAIMAEQSAIRRGQRTSARPTLPLAGKLYDVSGESLTPVHTRKAGRRYDYYISQSLKAAAAPGEKGSGWRLPARALEVRIIAAVRKHLQTATLRGLVHEANPQRVSDILASIDHGDADLLGVIDRVCIGRGTLEVTLDPVRLATTISTPATDLDPDHLTFRAAFTQRRRGVETRLLFEGDAIPRDETLLRNIAKGHAFLDLITSGRSVQQIAGERDLSVRRVQQTVEFAFLSPDVVRQVKEGRQAVSLTTDWCLRHEIPVDWTEQARLFTAAGSALFPNS